MSPRLRACGLSDVGRSRAVNEDSFVICAEMGLYLVADGMGGHGHGDVASRLAAESIRDSLCRTNVKHRGAPPLRNAILKANDRLREAVDNERRLTGMGTTIVAFLTDGVRGVIAHVGDSRAYRLRGGQLQLLTNDHTWVAEQVTAGRLTEDQARVHPFKSVVTRALGSEVKVDVELLEIGVAAGDLYLLCSDGLTTMISDEEILECLIESRRLDGLCRALVAAANRSGGRDNVTALVLRVEDVD